MQIVWPGSVGFFSLEFYHEINSRIGLLRPQYSLLQKGCLSSHTYDEHSLPPWDDSCPILETHSSYRSLLSFLTFARFPPGAPQWDQPGGYGGPPYPPGWLYHPPTTHSTTHLWAASWASSTSLNCFLLLPWQLINRILFSYASSSTLHPRQYHLKWVSQSVGRSFELA